MLLKTYIRSYLQIPVIQGIGLFNIKDREGIYLFKSNQLQSIEETITAQLRDYQQSNPNAKEFILPGINQWIYIHSLKSGSNFITISLHDNQVIKNFRAQQLQQKLVENLDESLKVFKDMKSSMESTEGGENHNNYFNLGNETETLNHLQEKITITQILEALNTLSQFTSEFIGARIISNFWNVSKPTHSFIARFHIRHTAEIKFEGSIDHPVSPLEVLIIRQWTQNFMKKCDEVIRDLPNQIEKAGFIEHHRKLISIYTPEYLHNTAIQPKQQDESLFGDVFN